LIHIKKKLSQESNFLNKFQLPREN